MSWEMVAVGCSVALAVYLTVRVSSLELRIAQAEAELLGQARALRAAEAALGEAMGKDLDLLGRVKRLEGVVVEMASEGGEGGH